MAGYYDGLEYKQLNSVPDLLSEILKSRNIGRIIYAHNGGRFDFLFLMSEIEKRGYPCEMCVQSASVTLLKIEISPSKYIYLQDSFALLPYSLQTLSDTFKPAHRKIKDAIDFEKEQVSKSSPLHCEYLKNDCLSLYEIIEIYKTLPFIKDVPLKLTRASTSLAAWRTTLKAPIKVTPQFVQDFTRAAYAGGRCEIFKQYMNEGACVDVNSLYPTMMLKPLPGELICESSDVTDFGFHDVTVSVPHVYMPVLWKKDTKLIFPTGTWRGTFFSEEIKLAIQNGARIEKHHKGYLFSKTSDLFTEFITRCYTLRKENPDNALNIVAKDLMNHCYGKTGEKEWKKTLLKVDPKNPESWPKVFSEFHSEKMFQKTGLIEIEKFKRAPHMLVHIAAAVTAYGRIHMAENLYLPYQDAIYYTDTDSGFTTKQFPTGKELGELKTEYEIKRGFFLLPKGYYIEKKDGKIIKKLKGFKKSYLDTLSYNSFKNSEFNYTNKSIATLKSALIRENSYLVMTENKKTVKSNYNKRRILGNGNTEPWIINNEGKIENAK